MKRENKFGLQVFRSLRKIKIFDQRLSVSAVTKTGFKFLFDDESVFLFNCDWKLQIQGTTFVDNLYYLNINPSRDQVTDDSLYPLDPVIMVIVIISTLSLIMCVIR